MSEYLGYYRPDGSVGIRNYVVVIPSVSCVNGVVGRIVDAVPEVKALCHGHGCGRFSPDIDIHYKTLINIGKNPNVAAVLVIGLGCEVLNGEKLAMAIAETGKLVEFLSVQQEGGSLKTAHEGIKIVNRMLEETKKIQRTPFTLDKLTIGLECGGSDAFSGVTANPSVGFAVDWLVNNGGTAILTETTEMIGTTHILQERGCCPDVSREIVKIIDNQEKLTEKLLGPLAKVVIAPGNMDGGLSSILEKSLGCIVKSGTTPIVEVFSYSTRPTKKGLVIMDGPGYDTEGMSGLAASGAQIILFTTGRGNPVGFPIVPVAKIASNSDLFNRMSDDMDVDAGVILEGKEAKDVGNDIISLIKQVIDGKPTKAETNQKDHYICLYTTGPSF